MKTQTYSQPKDLKAIAAEISRQYAADDCHLVDPLPKYLNAGPCRPLVEFRIGSLAVRCIDSPEAVARIVTRYRKAAGRHLGHSHSLPKMLTAERACARGIDYGAKAVVEHETMPA